MISVDNYSPSSGPAGTKVTIKGSNFTKATQVLISGTGAPFSVLSDCEILVVVPATVAPGNIAVVTPSGVAVSHSNFTTIEIVPPQPNPALPNPSGAPYPALSVTSISPSTVSAGGPGFTLTVNGAGFTKASVVKISGTNQTTAFVTSTQLKVEVPAADVVLGTFPVGVVDPLPNGAFSNTVALTVI